MEGLSRIKFYFGRENDQKSHDKHLSRYKKQTRPNNINGKRVGRKRKLNIKKKLRRFITVITIKVINK